MGHPGADRGDRVWHNVWPQVARAASAYAARCAACHGPNGNDGFAPAVTGAGSLSRFVGVRELLAFVSATMPQNAPGSLSTQDCLDITSFMITWHGVVLTSDELSLANVDATPLNPSQATPAPTAGP
ncbi:MAG: c-type cytochrome, partial [Actinobacteria bacterium]|nr:c-type cytochrome [Actinomycetota bacterium]